VKTLKRLIQCLFYSLVFALLLSRAVSSGISHDENQFIAPGQLLADHGLLPYRDYPYTHMPYGVVLYALSAGISNYDYLAGRILGAVTWLACILLIIGISRTIGKSNIAPSRSAPSVDTLFGEFVMVFIFLYHPISGYVLGAALNHSFATFFSLLALFYFLRGLLKLSSLRAAAFGSGLCISLAAWVRFNYASLIVVLLAAWLLYALTQHRSQLFETARPLTAGLLVASLPALGLIALAPAAFFYGNIVYVRLNTLYYEGILFRQTMDLPSKLSTFLNSVLHSPIDIVLYAMLIFAGVVYLARFLKGKSALDLIGLTTAAFAGILFLAAFAPTPTQAHYFFAPLPFMLIIVALLAWDLCQRSRLRYTLLFVGLLVALAATIRIPDPVNQLADLLHPSDWTPLQVHEFGQGLKAYVPASRMLTLFSMIPMEAGYEAYPFTATGPFSWRTSLLLTSERRAHYGLISPEELPRLLDASPPAGILTGFEAPNAGFKRQDLGGLEKPFIDYAMQHGYRPIPLSPKFLEHTLILWVRQP
jgi:hypothetical protein